MEIAVLFLIFNRPDTSGVVFNEIRKAKPKRLYVAADGPREGKNEELLCVQTRRIIDKIDWDCELFTLFRSNNLGCKMAVSSAITWFFENEEMGIILEDDCLPHFSFFYYCESLLNYYKYDQRVVHISGNNFLSTLYVKDSYFFSQFPHIWGWATWRRAWEIYDIEMKELKALQKEENFLFYRKEENKRWLTIFNQVKRGDINTWDYQWTYSIFVNNGLCINPKQNLVTNIGFNGQSTHTFEADSPFPNVKISEILLPLSHPKIKVPNRIYDNFLQNDLFLCNFFKREILNRLRYYFNKFKK